MAVARAPQRRRTAAARRALLLLAGALIAVVLLGRKVRRAWSRGKGHRKRGVQEV